ncbi:hypothetical protein ROZALSC1DRAFT_25541, partial [Rozella allomycis CSF55]
EVFAVIDSSGVKYALFSWKTVKIRYAFLSPEDQDKVLRNDTYIHATRDGIVDVPFNPSENRGIMIVESAKCEVDQMAATHRRLFAKELKIVQNLVPYSSLEKCTSYTL